MNSRERVVIYGLLMTLLVVNLCFLLGAPGYGGSAAYAAPLNQGDILGPADALELVGADDEEPLSLRNTDGHLSWGDSHHQQAYAIGYVHIGRILNQQLAAEEFEEERQALIEESQEKDEEYRTLLDDLFSRTQGLDADSPEGQDLQQQGSALFQEYRTWQQQMAVQRDALNAEHLERAYRELIAAVNIVADRKGIDIVTRFIPTDNPFLSQTMEQGMRAIRLRPVLRSPEDLDITIDVLDELSLDTE